MSMNLDIARQSVELMLELQQIKPLQSRTEHLPNISAVYFFFSNTNGFCSPNFTDIFLVIPLEILLGIGSHKYKMVTQIQNGDANTTWQHKYNMATQIQQGDTNTTWRHKYNMSTQIQLDDTNTVLSDQR